MNLQQIIDGAWEHRANISPGAELGEVRAAVNETIAQLDAGRLRVAEKVDGAWVVHQWVKKAVLLSFRLHNNQLMEAGGYTRFFDKVDSKFASFSESDFQAGGYRVVPPAMVRRGAFIAKNAVLMPSYVNIGAYVDEGTMVDTWATVGSCAQIGKNVHLSGGVGIGGVLEPLQANPTIIEDNCFIGARSEVVEGVVVEENSVLGMGVFIGQSTKIFNRETGEVSYGRVPSGSVVVAGSLPSNGCHLYCAVIVKRVDAKTRAKTGINELLREGTR
jgi:2,3,4,5-tetrahydropyridine-2-carboxylate N-succinyltransferase